MSDFRLHGETEEAPLLHAVAEGSAWSGWASPWATAEAVRSYVTRQRAIDPDGWGYVLTEEEHVPDHLTITRPDTTDPEEWDRFPVAGHVNGERVYDLSGWVWTPAN